MGNIIEFIKKNLYFDWIGWGGGDPHILTYDDLSYTFNGLGQFILTKTDDSLMEIHANTELFTSATGLIGTIFNGFAVKVGDSSVVQIELSDSTAKNPFLSK